MRLALILSAAWGLGFCAERDETLYSYGAANKEWRLSEMHGGISELAVTLRFDEPGVFSGEGPCNSFSAAQNAPYPWFEVSDLLTTKRHCEAIDDETDFLRNLSSMTLSEVSGSVLILSDDKDAKLVFRVHPDRD